MQEQKTMFSYIRPDEFEMSLVAFRYCQFLMFVLSYFEIVFCIILLCVSLQKGRPVPIIIPPVLKKALAFIGSTATRMKAGVAASNRYLFPNTGI